MRPRTRRIAAIAIVALQLALIVRAYSAPIDTFGFQMFPESSQWRADVYRILADGRRVSIREPWPGGYRWDQLVEARGLGVVSVLHHADAGLEATVWLFDAALDWVAENTPEDRETVQLVAELTLIHNGREPTTLVLESESRS